MYFRVLVSLAFPLVNLRTMIVSFAEWSGCTCHEITYPERCRPNRVFSLLLVWYRYHHWPRRWRKLMDVPHSFLLNASLQIFCPPASSFSSSLWWSQRSFAIPSSTGHSTQPSRLSTLRKFYAFPMVIYQWKYNNFLLISFFWLVSLLVLILLIFFVFDDL